MLPVRFSDADEFLVGHPRPKKILVVVLLDLLLPSSALSVKPCVVMSTLQVETYNDVEMDQSTAVGRV